MLEFLILVVLFLVLMAIRMPVAYAMMVSSAIYLVASDLPLLQLHQRIAAGVDSFPLLAIPMFLLAGNLMNTMGITERIFNFAAVLVRHIAGGLAHVNIIASVIFSGVSGSAVADAGGLGVVEKKAMGAAGYDHPFTAALTAASATIGPVIPPSIIMVIYGFVAEQSVGKLFIAGFIPGLLMAAAMMILVYGYARFGVYDFPVFPRASLREAWDAFLKAFLPCLAPVVLMAGLIGGAFTPTEAGMVMVLFVAAAGFVYMRFTFAHVLEALRESVRTTVATCFIIAASMIYSYIITIQKVPEIVTESLVTYIDSPLGFYAFVIVVLLLFGMILEAIPILIITVPTFIVLAEKFGVDQIQLGIVSVLVMMIGSITPPVGLTLFTVMKVHALPMGRIVRPLIPFYFALLAVVIVVVLVPGVATWLPSLFF